MSTREVGGQQVCSLAAGETAFHTCCAAHVRRPTKQQVARAVPVLEACPFSELRRAGCLAGDDHSIVPTLLCCCVSHVADSQELLHGRHTARFVSHPHNWAFAWGGNTTQRHLELR